MPSKKKDAQNITSDTLRDAWENLGIAFAFNKSETNHADPEKTLLQALKEFNEDKKMLKLTLAWLKEYGQLVHVERLRALAVSLSAAELAWLGGLALYQVENADFRWRAIVQFVEKKLGNPSPQFLISPFEELQAKRLGADPCFKKFGLSIPLTVASDAKKIRSRQHVVAGNLWLRTRTLFGTNWRADIATVMVEHLVETPYQASKLLGCNYETASRNWKSLKEAQIETLLKK